MDSLDDKCTPLKTKYEECFNAWFRDSFLKGRSDHDETCGRLFLDYQKCVKVGGERARVAIVNNNNYSRRLL